ncbi:MAG: adenylate/guanylate cyclase domain-containing protein, partial [Acidimicrobiales bacterium]|nr:adenylate/guanylate cyclase domain-containing protein [Acidimicrobiales bacterium]MCB1018198.1 adenylate/guanylate cyclase domain-containing protein [Acidimicrobiales bacterium]
MPEAQTVAVLFTDLVGSTARQAEVGDERFDEIRRTHFAVLRDVVEAHQGTEVKNLGDGLMVVFRSASNAIAAAVSMQVENDRHGRAHPELAVGLKVAAAMGDAVLEEDDWFGTPVVEAARLCAVCDAGQLLVTESLRLMAGSRTEATVEPIGELALKGLPAPVPTCEVRWEAAEVVAGVPLPGLFTGDGAAPFAGRSAERATLDRLWKEAGS